MTGVNSGHYLILAYTMLCYPHSLREATLSISNAVTSERLHTKGFKYELRPTPDQAIELNKILGCSRKVYNELLAISQNDYLLYKNGLSEVKPNVTQYSLINLSTQLKYRTDLYYLKAISSIVIQQKAIDLSTAFNNFFKHRSGYPRFKKRGYNDSFRIVGKDSIRISQNGIIVPNTQCGPIQVLWSRDLPSEPSSYTVTRTASGRYYISFVCQYVPNRPSGTNQVGIDLGVKDLAVMSNGTILPNPKWYHLAMKKLAHLQRQLARKVKNSINYHTARIRLAKWHEYISNSRKDYMHKLTSKLIGDNQAISIEDLNVKGMVRNRHLAKSIIQSGFGQFRQYLVYKVMESISSYLIIADRWYPSTQLCSYCGVKSPTRINLSMRQWQCGQCGTTHHRDANAASNLEALIPSALQYIEPGHRIVLMPALDY